MASYLFLIFALVCSGAFAETQQFSSRRFRQSGSQNRRGCARNDGGPILGASLKCEQCKTFVQGMSEYLADKEPSIYVLEQYCRSISPPEKAGECFMLVFDNGADIMNLLADKQSAQSTCIGIQMCDKPKTTFCLPCREYANLGNSFGYDAYTWEMVACKNYFGSSATLCMQSLRKVKPQLMKINKNDPKTSVTQMCVQVEMCELPIPVVVRASSEN